MPFIRKGAKKRAKEVVWEATKSIPRMVVERVKDYVEKRYRIGKTFFHDLHYITRGAPSKKRDSR